MYAVLQKGKVSSWKQEAFGTYIPLLGLTDLVRPSYTGGASCESKGGMNCKGSNALVVRGIFDRLSQNAGGGREGWLSFCFFERCCEVSRGGGAWPNSRWRLRELVRSVMCGEGLGTEERQDGCGRGGILSPGDSSNAGADGGYEE